MAASSSMLDLGTPLPSFALPDVSTGNIVRSGDFDGRIGVVAFICNHCPYVKHVQEELTALGRHCEKNGIKMVAISSNDVSSYPEDGPRHMTAEARRAGYVFPYLYDETQTVAKAFHAMCTPEIYVFDAAGRLAYRGRLCESTPKNGLPVTGSDVRTALATLLAGGAPSRDQKPSIGCSIKWKNGGAPAYAL
jgi:hypothetical protein